MARSMVRPVFSNNDGIENQMTFCTDVLGPQRTNPGDFGDSHHEVLIFGEISCHPLDGLTRNLAQKSIVPRGWHLHHFSYSATSMSKFFSRQCDLLARNLVETFLPTRWCILRTLAKCSIAHYFGSWPNTFPQAVNCVECHQAKMVNMANIALCKSQPHRTVCLVY